MKSRSAGRGVSAFFRVAGTAVWLIVGIWVFILCLNIVSKTAGFFGVVLAFGLFPVTISLIPLYAGFALGDWTPLVMDIVAAITGGLLFIVADTINGKEDEHNSQR